MALAPMQPLEALALARLRQWRSDRTQANSCKVTAWKRQGWQDRRANIYDARIVRMIDFERALGTLPAEQQALLILHYADRETVAQTAIAIGCSERKVAYMLPEARRALTHILQVRDLL